MKRKFKSLTLLFLLAGTQLAVNADYRVTPQEAGCEYLAYPVNNQNAPKLTPAPKGYLPFHIEHYGRHGSRWLTDEGAYRRPMETLQKASAAGKLTPLGEELLSKITAIQKSSVGRTGELTPLGHRQHREIAQRIYKNFPQIFTPGTRLDARSTVVVRCILSMAEEMAELERLAPGLQTTMDASYSSYRILDPNLVNNCVKHLTHKVRPTVDEFERKHTDYTEFMKRIFNDPVYAQANVDASKLFGDLFLVGVNNQSHDDQPSIMNVFSDKEIQNKWKCNNAWWYAFTDNTPLTDHRPPYWLRILVEDMIAGADSAMVSKQKSVNMRFGHEAELVGLAVLMEFNGGNISLNSLDDVAENWQAYKYYPMASNLQFVFYRPEKKPQYDPEEVLVKVLLNEKEAKVDPLTPVSGPYYKWSDFRKYYRNKLDSSPYDIEVFKD